MNGPPTGHEDIESMTIPLQVILRAILRVILQAILQALLQAPQVR